MEKNELVKKDICDLLSHYFGENLSSSYFAGYGDETLPIYLHNAYLLLSNQLGEDKSKQEINEVLTHYSLSSIKYD